jgi:hypothetical protein
MQLMYSLSAMLSDFVVHSCHPAGLYRRIYHEHHDEHLKGLLIFRAASNISLRLLDNLFFSGPDEFISFSIISGTLGSSWTPNLEIPEKFIETQLHESTHCWLLRGLLEQKKH